MDVVKRTLTALEQEEILDYLAYRYAGADIDLDKIGIWLKELEETRLEHEDCKKHSILAPRIMAKAIDRLRTKNEKLENDIKIYHYGLGNANSEVAKMNLIIDELRTRIKEYQEVNDLGNIEWLADKQKLTVFANRITDLEAGIVEQNRAGQELWLKVAKLQKENENLNKIIQDIITPEDMENMLK